MSGDGRPHCDMDESLRDLVRRLAGIRAHISRLKEDEEETLACLRQKLDNYAGAMTSDGRKAITYATIQRRDLDQRRLKAERPDIAKAYTVVRQSRPLRVEDAGYEVAGGDRG